MSILREFLSFQFVCLITLCATHSHAFQSHGFKDIPLSSKITRVQPMTGVALWSDNDKVATDSISLEYRYCGYNEIVKPDGEYDFSKIESLLDETAARGHQAILRFYFVYVGKKTTVPDFIRKADGYDETVGESEGEKTHFCDWSNQKLKDFTLEFYTRLAQRYDSDPRLAFLQTGFGLWAEYHIYDGPNKLGKTFPDKTFQTRFIKHMDQSFKNLPWSISVDSADFDYSPLEDNKELLALNFGVFDDSFLCKNHPTENEENWKILQLDRWKRSPGGGEFSYYTDRDQKMALAKKGPNGVPFSKSAAQFHLSYIIGNDQPEFRTMKEIETAAMITGYRFKVTSAQRSDGGKGSTLRLKVTNNGIAPIYRDAYFAAGEKRSKTSLRGLLPGESKVLKIENVNDTEFDNISIQSDAILDSQTIQFDAELK